MRAILTYHSVDPSGSPISIDAAAFRRHIEWLATNSVSVLGVGDLLAAHSDSPAVALTFDDGFVNFADIAWPIMRDHDMPVTLFVPTAYVGRTNAWSADDHGIPNLPLLDWDRLGRLASEGVTLQSHTCTHRRLTQLEGEGLRFELSAAAEQLERHTGVRPTGLAYPYGAHDPKVVAAAARFYDFACTTELRVLSSAETRHRLPRLDTYYLRREGALEAWGTSRLKLYLRARANVRRCREILESGTAR